MRTVPQTATGHKPFPQYEAYAERQAQLDYRNDQQRFPSVWGNQDVDASDMDGEPWDEAPVQAWTPTYYADETARVMLGHILTADAQRQVDDEHGLAWLACHR